MKNLLTTILLSVMAMGMSAQDKIVAINITGKTISSVLTEEEMLAVDSLVLTGKISDSVYPDICKMCHDGKLRGVNMYAASADGIPALAFCPSASETEKLGIQYITLPKFLVSIGDRAFQNTALRQISIDSYTEKIGNSVFNNCPDLRSITMRTPFVPLDVTQSESFAGLPDGTVLYVPKGAKETYAADSRWKSFSEIRESDDAFVTKYADLSSGPLELALTDAQPFDSLVITGPLDDSDKSTLCTIIKTGRFRSLDLRGAVCENNELSLDYLTDVENPHLRYLRLPEGLEKISYVAGGSSLYDLRFPSTLKVIGDCSFEGATIHGDIHVTEGVTTLGFAAFRWSKSGPDMYLPSTLEYFDYASLNVNLDINKCWNLYVNRKTPPTYLTTHGGSPWGGWKDKKLPEYCTLYVPIGAAEAYRGDKWWSYFQNIIETPDLDGGQGDGISSAVLDNESTDSRIFTLDGRYAGKSLDALQSGIYVVNGKKIVKQ